MIHDQYTDLKVSRQRKWQLRHPAAFHVIKKRYTATPWAKASRNAWAKEFRETIESRVDQREYQRDRNHYLRRYLNARSYQDERRSNWGVA